jgi:hypothetical protein
MSDESNVGGSAAGEQETIASASTGGDAAVESVSAALAGDTGAAETPPPAEDWRTRMAAGDEKELARLKRFASEENYHKSYRALEKKLSERPAAPTLPEGATPEQIAEYRKTIGVPEAPDGYGLAFDAALQPSDADKAMLQGVLEQAHAAHVPPAHAKALFDAYQTQLIRAREEQAIAVEREFGKTKQELRQEYGPDYLRNVKVLEEWLEDKPVLGEIIKNNIHRKGVVQESIALALAMAPEDALFSGDAGSGGKSIDDRIAELRDMKLSGKITPPQIAEYDKLYEAKYARDQRRANGRRG